MSEANLDYHVYRRRSSGVIIVKKLSNINFMTPGQFMAVIEDQITLSDIDNNISLFERLNLDNSKQYYIYGILNINPDKKNIYISIKDPF